MTDMAEILTGLREAKQKLSEEYAETFIFLIEQIETALIEMGVLIYLNLTSQVTTTASAGSLGGKKRSANFIEVKEFVTLKYQEIIESEPDIKNVVAASRIEKMVSGKYTPFPLTETNIRNRLANWISSLKKYGKIP